MSESKNESESEAYFLLKVPMELWERHVKAWEQSYSPEPTPEAEALFSIKNGAEQMESTGQLLTDGEDEAG